MSRKKIEKIRKILFFFQLSYIVYRGTEVWMTYINKSIN